MNYPVPEFEPPWWLRGPHAQTLGGRALRSPRGVSLQRERLTTPDGDFLDLDFARVRGFNGAGRPLVVVLHGLEGSARSKYAFEMYRALAAGGVEAVGMNFRSCSGEMNRTARLYHSGETGDLAFVLDYLSEREPQRRLGAVGFSLGGNVLLKYLGERATSIPGAFLAAAAISVPFDLSAGADYLENGFARVYRRHLVGQLQEKIRAKRAMLNGRIDLKRATDARTFREFDDAATAPLHGFHDAEDYYGRSSSAQFLSTISIPTLLIHSRDDPFLPESAVPEASARSNPNLTLAFTTHGGHVGFVSGGPLRPIFWAEREAAAFLAAHLMPDQTAYQAR